MNQVFTIEQVFGERVFTVPDYQRGYAWERRQREEFLDDLDDIASNKDHYTGTLVLHARPDRKRFVDEEGKSYGHFDVVDGQQRLTTIVVLLDVLGRAMAARPHLAKLAEGTRKSYVAVRDLSGVASHKLRLDGDLHAWFADSVLADTPSPGGAATAAQARLLDARREFTEYVEGRRAKLGDGFEPWLLDLREKITQRLKLSALKEGRKPDWGKLGEAAIGAAVGIAVGEVFRPLEGLTQGNKILSGLVSEAKGFATDAATYGVLHAAGLNEGMAHDPFWQPRGIRAHRELYLRRRTARRVRHHRRLESGCTARQHDRAQRGLPRRVSEPHVKPSFARQRNDAGWPSPLRRPDLEWPPIAYPALEGSVSCTRSRLRRHIERAGHQQVCPSRSNR